MLYDEGLKDQSTLVRCIYIVTLSQM